MGMGFGLSMSQHVEQRLETSHRLTIDQRFALRLELLLVLGGTNYRPKAVCPKCGHVLTDAEILKGFNRDPNDLLTTCPKPDCRERLRAHLRWSSSAGSAELQFFCPTQTTHALEGRQGRSPEELEKDNPSVYHSAITHFGTLKTAFASIGVAYAFNERVDWRRKVTPFLGQMPDTLIAECAGISASSVRRLRTKQRIRPFVNVR